MAGIRYDLIDPKLREPEPSLRDGSEGFTGEFMKGLDSGTTGIGGGLRTLVGTGAEALGFDEFAQGQYAQAREAGLRAQAQAPRVSSYKDVGSFRDARDYVGGLLGGSAPSIAAGVGASIATGGAVVPGLIAGTLAQTPIEAGDVGMKQLSDPQAMAMPASERMARQWGGGVGSAALQSVVPAALGGKIMGRGAEQMAKRSIGQTLGHNALAIPEEGLFEGASEALKQTASNNAKPLDWDAIKENAIGGAAAGGAMGGVGTVADLAHGLPRKAIGGAKDLATGANGAAKGAVTSAPAAAAGAYTAATEHPAVQAAWASAGETASSVLQAANKGFDGHAPQFVKDGAAWAKSSVGNASAEARTWARELMESDSVPDALKAQVTELAKSLNNRSSRVGIWAIKQASDAAGAAKETLFGEAPTAGSAGSPSIVSRLRAMGKEDDTADRIIKGEPVGDRAAIAAAQGPGLTSLVGASDEAKASWAGKAFERLSKLANLSPENQQRLAEAGSDFSSAAAQSKIALVANAVKVSTGFSRKLTALSAGFKAGMDAKAADGSAKKSEDFSGIRSVIEKTVAPMLADSHPQLLENPKELAELANNIRLFIADASKGDNEAMLDHTRRFSDLLGADVAHDMLSEIYTTVEGDSPAKAAKAAKYFGTIVDSRLDHAKTKSLAEVIDAQDLTGKGGDPVQYAQLLRQFARGESDRDASPAQKQNNILSVRSELAKTYGEKGANQIWNALEKDTRESAPKIARGRDEVVDEHSDGTDTGGEAGSESDGVEYGTTTEKEAKSWYVGKGSDADTDMPKLYGNPRLHPKGSEYPHAVNQAIDKINIEDPSARAHFVSMRDYGRARGWSESYMVQMAGGKDPSDVGFIKGERMDAGDGLQQHQLSAMKLGNNFRRRKGEDGRMVDSPDAILAKVQGRETPDYIDARKVASVMHKTAKDEWSEGDSKAGWATRLATKFAEGIAALTEHYGSKLDVRDDQVIGHANGKDLTWGEAQQLIKDRKTVPLDKGTKGERQAREMVPELNDQELARTESKVLTTLQDKEDALRKTVVETLKSEGVTLTKAAINARFRAELKAQRLDEASGFPPLDRMASALRSEKDKRSGESRRETVMDTGMETREGYGDLGKKARRGDDGYTGAPGETVSNPDAGSNSAPGRRAVDQTSESDRRVESLIDDFLGIKPGKAAESRTAEFTDLASEGEENEAVERDKARQRSVISAARRDAQVKAGVKLPSVGDRPANYSASAKAELAAGHQVPFRDAPFDKGRSTYGSGRTEGDPNGNIHDAGALLNADDLMRHNTALGGKAEPLTINNTRNIAELEARLKNDSSMTPKRAAMLRDTIAALKDEHGAATRAGEKLLDEKIARMEASAVLGIREMGRQAKELSEHVPAMVREDRARFSSLMYLRGLEAGKEGGEAGMRGLSNKDAAVIINDLAAHYGVAGRAKAKPATDRGATLPANPVKFKNGRVAAEQGGTPSPKAVAAKKAALLEKAASGDKGLITELAASTDAKGLQRAVEALGGKDSAALDAANQRLGELVQDPQTALGMQGKKYSLMSTQVHDDLERPGFAATHDSPIRHEGRFDWREHTGKGEGNASFGAGTYLSTAEGVHKSYKDQFSATLPGEETVLFGGKPPSNETMEDLARDIRNDGRRQVIADIKANLKDMADWGQAPLTLRFIAEAHEKLALAESATVMVSNNISPTYHVSVDIKPEQLLDWNRPLNEQSESVKKALAKDGVRSDGEPLAWEREDGEHIAYTEDGVEYAVRSDDAGTSLYRDGDFVGSYEYVAQAKMAAAMKEGAGNITGEALYNSLAGGKGSQAAASEHLQSLGILGHKYAASGGTNDAHPNYVIYDDSKIGTNYVHFDKTKAARPNPMSPKAQAQVTKIAEQLFGQGTKVDFANIPHAGEYANGLMTVSVHALNPNGVLYHESMHKLFDLLGKSGNKDVAAVLEKSGSSVAVMGQLRKLLANEPDALKQLSDPEERAAYMYQYWANGQLSLGEKATTLFGKIAEAIRSVLGIWTNDERSLQIMEHFSSGELAGKGGAAMNAVSRSLMEGGRNQRLEALHGMAKPFMDLAENAVGAGSANLRDSGIVSLANIADLVKKQNTAAGEDAGVIPATRIAKGEFIGKYVAALNGADPAHVQEALEALQQGTKASSPEARIVQRGVRKVLDDLHAYLTAAGVKVGDLGLGVDYFPRQWDPHYLSKNKVAFMDMARKYPSWTSAEDSYNKIVANDGSELQVVDKPGMSAMSKRVLGFISHADAAPFMSKDMHRIMNSYITQATRRGEWSRRLGADNEKLTALYAAAAQEGATPQQIEQAKKFISGVNGTLGDDLNPTMRRTMGNMIVYQNIRLLPLAVFSMAVDPNGIMVRGGTLRDAWNTLKRGITEIPMGLRGKAGTDAQTRFAAEMDTIDNAVLQHAIGSMYTQGVTGNFARKANDTFFKYNLVEQMNTSMRVGATEAAMGFLARHGDGKHSAHSERYLAELGLKPADITKGADGRVKTRESDGLSPEHAAKMKAAVNMWVDGAVLRPDAADKPVWMNDPHFMLFAHLKQFTYAFQHTILARVVHEARNGNYTPAMALASYVPMMIAADLVKGMIQGGGDQPEWKKGWGVDDYVGNGLQRAGLFGVGQIGVDAMKNIHEGGTGIGQLMGPTVEQFGDAVQMLGGHKQFGSMALHSLPANQLYLHAFNDASPDPTFAE